MRSRPYPQQPSGQRTMVRIPPPKETALVSALLYHLPLVKFEGRPIIPRLSRSPAGEFQTVRWQQGVCTPGSWVRGAPEGWSDLTGFIAGHVPLRAGKILTIECKRGNEQLTPAQIEFLTDVREADGVAIEARIGWEETLDEILDAVGLVRDRSEIVLTVRRKVA